MMTENEMAIANHLYHLPNCEYSVFAIELVTV